MKIFLLFIHLIKLFQISFSLIVLPFKTKNILKYSNKFIYSFEIEDILQNYFFERQIYSNIKISTDQQIELYYDLNIREMNIRSFCSHCDIYYNYSKSLSYKELNKIQSSSIYNSAIVNETLYFQNIFYNYSSNYKSSEGNKNQQNILKESQDHVKGEFTILMSKNLPKKSDIKDKKNFNYIEIGFQVPLKQEKNKLNTPSFIEQLKRNGLIDNYIWNIFFFNDENNIKTDYDSFYNKDNDEYEGVFVLGAPPHKYIKNKFKEENLIEEYTYIDKNIETDWLQWGISFDEIYYFKNKTEKEKNWIMTTKVIFDLGISYIIAPNEVFNRINYYYFNELIKNKICHLTSIKSYYMIYCNETFYAKGYIKKIPDLNFYSKKYDYNFILNYNDLFSSIQRGRYYIFNIIFECEEDGDEYEYFFGNKWIFGRIFFKKYQMTFDSDSKLIGFYNTKKTQNIFPNDKEKIDRDNEDNQSNKKQSETFMKNIILVTIGGVIFIFLFSMFIFIVKKILLKNGFVLARKKHVNEINDDFEYNNCSDEIYSN